MGLSARIRIAALAGLLATFALVPASASARIIVWTLHNVDFGSADPVSGSFTINTVKGVTQINISSAFGAFDLSDMQGGNPLDLSDGIFFGHSLLLQNQYGLTTNVPSQLAFNPLFGGSDIDGFTELTLSLKDGPFISGASGAPESPAWGLMLLGVGGLGAAMRRRRTAVIAAA